MSQSANSHSRGAPVTATSPCYERNLPDELLVDLSKQGMDPYQREAWETQNRALFIAAIDRNSNRLREQMSDAFSYKWQVRENSFADQVAKLESRIMQLEDMATTDNKAEPPSLSDNRDFQLQLKTTKLALARSKQNEEKWRRKNAYMATARTNSKVKRLQLSNDLLQKDANYYKVSLTTSLTVRLTCKHSNNQFERSAKLAQPEL